MLHTNSLGGEPPAATKIRSRIGGQTARAVLQYGTQPAGTRRGTQQEPTMAEKGIEQHVGAGDRFRHGQRSRCERKSGLPAEQGKPAQRRLRDLGIGVDEACPERIGGKSVRRRSSRSARAPQPAAEQLVDEPLRPLRPQCRTTQWRQGFKCNEARCERCRRLRHRWRPQQIRGGRAEPAVQGLAQGGDRIDANLSGHCQQTDNGAARFGVIGRQPVPCVLDKARILSRRDVGVCHLQTRSFCQIVERSRREGPDAIQHISIDTLIAAAHRFRRGPTQHACNPTDQAIRQGENAGGDVGFG